MGRQAESITVARAALNLALSSSRSMEKALQEKYLREGLKTTAVDYGGEFLMSMQKVVERTVVAAKREGVIEETHLAEGGIAGATREALSQIMPKAIGLNVGGKVGIARKDDHIVVAAFFAIGLLHLNEIGVGIGHRVISTNAR